MAVHPGSVDSEIQKNADNGPMAKLKKLLTRTTTKTDEEGAEVCLWAATCTDINADNWKEYQVSSSALSSHEIG